MEDLLFIFASFMAVIIVVGLIFYLLYAVGLYSLAKNQGIDNAWLAFLPIANLYIEGLLIGPNNMIYLGKTIEKPEVLLPLISFFGGFLAGIPFIGPIIAVLVIIFIIKATHALFKRYRGDSATMLTIVSYLIPGLYHILIFSMRKREPIE